MQAVTADLASLTSLCNLCSDLYSFDQPLKTPRGVNDGEVVGIGCASCDFLGTDSPHHRKIFYRGVSTADHRQLVHKEEGARWGRQGQFPGVED